MWGGLVLSNINPGWIVLIQPDTACYGNRDEEFTNTNPVAPVVVSKWQHKPVVAIQPHRMQT
jgi:hypothetical protein